MLLETFCTNSLHWFAVRYPSWIPNSTEADNCTKNEQMNKLIFCWRTVIFCNYKVSIQVNKLCIQRKNIITKLYNYVLIKKINHNSVYFSFSTVFINKEGLIVDLKNKNKEKFLTLDGCWNFESHPGGIYR